MEYIFPQKLKELREKNGLTLRELSKGTGFSHVAINRWELGTQVPNIQTLVVFAKYFNVSCDYLLGLEDNVLPLAKK